nr:hypothetical protein [Morganella morganii]
MTGSEAAGILAGSLGIGGIAKIAAVVITDAGGKQIKLGTPSAAQALRDGNNDLIFSAYLQVSAAAAYDPGHITAIATAPLSYQ